MSSEEEMHMLPSFCEGVPSDMSPSEWCLVLFPALPAELSREIGDRGSNGEKKMLRHFLEMGFKWRKGDVAAFSGERGSYWRSRVIVRRLGFKLEIGVHYVGKKEC